MKKNLFLLGSFLTSALLVANTLQLISCNQKLKGESKDDENAKNSEHVILEKKAKLKAEIKSAIDDIISSPNLEDEWIINLVAEFGKISYKGVVKKLDEASKGLDGDVKKGLNDVDANLLDKVNEKFVDLAELVTIRVNNKLDELGISDFDFVFDQDSIFPQLTGLNGNQVIKSIQKLRENSENKYSSISNHYPIINKINEVDKPIDIKDLPENITIELFKVTTDLNYTFSFEGRTDVGDYKECELFLTGDIENYRNIKKFTQATIENLIKSNEETKVVRINSGEIENEEELYPNINKEYNWDFSDANVKNEIKTIQYEKIKESTDKLDLDELVLKSEYINFEPLNYMKFTNKDIRRTQDYGYCLLYCLNGGLIKTEYNYPKENGEVKLNIKQKIRKYFGITQTANIDIEKKWDGGWVNNEFVKKIDQDIKENNLKIDVSDYYGLGAKADDSSDFLLGYGTTSISNTHYGGLSLATMNITTSLAIEYDPQFMTMYKNFENYVLTLISAVRNEKGEKDKANKGILARKTSSLEYFIQWNFGYTDEWKAIQDEIKKNGVVTFNWIMEEILLKKRVLAKNSKYKLTNDIINLKSKTSLYAEEDVSYIRCETGKCSDAKRNDHLLKSDFKSTPLVISIKYGPFKFYITDTDSKTIWRTGEKNSAITNLWKDAPNN